MAAKFYALGKAKALGLTEITVFPKKQKKNLFLSFTAGKLLTDSWSFESTGHQVDKTDRSKGEMRNEIK